MAWNSEERRVVVTGMGVVTPIGDTVPAFWDALVAGRSGITRWKAMDERVEARIGGDMSDFNLDAHLARGGGYPTALVERAQRTMRTATLSGRVVAAAALQAYTASGLAESAIEPERMGHVLGGHNFNDPYLTQNVQEFEAEPEYIDSLYGVQIFDTDILARVSELLNARGVTYTVGNACASGNMALMRGLDLLRSGRADAVIVSAAAFDLAPALLQAWVMMGAVAADRFNDAPERASRPFDRLRQGFVPGMGGGAVILETLAGARARGAPIQAELLGAGAACSASRLTRPFPEGQVRAMRYALDDARVNPEQVRYINAHGTSTPIGDATEVSAIKELFGEGAYRIPVNSTKSLIGHCLTGSSMIEFVATILQLQHGILHPTINQDEPDPELDLDFVPNQAREHRMDVALSNSFGFGNLNACVVVGGA